MNETVKELETEWLEPGLPALLCSDARILKLSKAS